MQKIKDIVDVVYSDTDSIVFFKKDLLKLTFLIDPLLIGGLKLEGFYETACFLAPKTYFLQKKNIYIFKMKGIDRQSLSLSDNFLKLYFLNILKNEYQFKLSEFTINSFLKNIHSLDVLEKSILRSYEFNSLKRVKVLNYDHYWFDTLPLAVYL